MAQYQTNSSRLAKGSLPFPGWGPMAVFPTILPACRKELGTF